MKFDKLIKSLESFRELIKSNYGPKGSGQYSSADNQRRKSRNAEENVAEGPNKNAKRYTGAARGTAKQQAAKEARTMRAASKKNPIKIYTPKEVAAANVKREKIKIDKNGQWKMDKTGGFGTAMTVGGGGVTGMPLGAANKTEKKSKTIED